MFTFILWPLRLNNGTDATANYATALPGLVQIDLILYYSLHFDFKTKTKN